MLLTLFYSIISFTVLTYNDEQFHLLERIKMTETFKSLESLFTAECVPVVTNTADLLADWYKYGILLFSSLFVWRMIIFELYLKNGAGSYPSN